MERSMLAAVWVGLLSDCQWQWRVVLPALEPWTLMFTVRLGQRRLQPLHPSTFFYRAVLCSKIANISFLWGKFNRHLSSFWNVPKGRWAWELERESVQKEWWLSPGKRSHGFWPTVSVSPNLVSLFPSGRDQMSPPASWGGLQGCVCVNGSVNVLPSDGSWQHRLQ